MKKMMIIAAFVSAMLMPAQIMAQNNHRNNRRPVAARVEHNRKGEHRKDMHIQNGNHRPIVNHKPAHKPVVVHHHQPAPPPVVVHHHQPAPPPVVVHHHQPAPPPVVVHHPAPRPVIHSQCSSEVAGVAAVAIGVAGLISLLAD